MVLYTQQTLCDIYQGAVRLSCWRCWRSLKSALSLLSVQSFTLKIFFAVLLFAVRAAMKHGDYQLDTVCVYVCRLLQYDHSDVPLAVIFLSSCFGKNIYFAPGSSLWEASSLMYSIDHPVDLHVKSWSAEMHIDKELHFPEDQRYRFLVSFFGKL